MSLTVEPVADRRSIGLSSISTIHLWRPSQQPMLDSHFQIAELQCESITPQKSNIDTKNCHL